MKVFFQSILVFAVWTLGCSHKAPAEPQKAIPVESALSQQSVMGDTPKGEESKKTPTLSGQDLERFNQVMTAVLTNNDKKAKLAYGRHHKYLPEIVQFAFDLRFKNYQHALEMLPKWVSSKDEKDFWEKIINKAPNKLADAICEEVHSQELFPTTDYKVMQFDETPFGKELQDLAFNLAPKAKEKAKKTTWGNLDNEMNKLGCSLNIDNGNCGPLNSSQKATFLNQAFFDNLRNAQRRDSRYYKENAHTPLKISEYRGEFQRPNLYLLYRAIVNTESIDRNHYLRRIRGIAADMRPDVLFHRTIGAMILGDENDIKFVKRLKYFSSNYPIISVTNHLDLDLAGCKVPPIKTFIPIPYKKPEPTKTSEKH